MSEAPLYLGERARHVVRLVERVLDAQLRRVLVLELAPARGEREFFIDNLLVQIHFIIVMIRWIGLAPWEFELPVDGLERMLFIKSVLSNK